ncbi:MAG TPA: formate/nitrite transporter family protein [Actinomycetota bacterium]|nr:formate/nitrite transporter family protein [Actinomycetota bacterium]
MSTGRDDEETGSDEPSDELRIAFEATVDEGVRRLTRSWPRLVATGLVGGIDISVGVFALLLTLQETHSVPVGALAFGIGFLALLLARSELFTENFLVPIAAVVATKARWRDILRLWAGTAVTNYLGGWIVMAVALTAYPGIRNEAVSLAVYYPRLGIGWTSFASALMAGTVMTLMTWMERGTTSTTAKMVASFSAAYVLATGHLDHAIISGLEMFAGLQAGAPFGYVDWARTVGWAALGNMIGGIGFVTVLRIVQVGGRQLSEERNRPLSEPRGGG